MGACPGWLGWLGRLSEAFILHDRDGGDGRNGRDGRAGRARHSLDGRDGRDGRDGLVNRNDRFFFWQFYMDTSSFAMSGFGTRLTGSASSAPLKTRP